MNREELVLKLSLVSRALAQNDLVPMFQNVAFTGNQIIAYNDALGIISHCKMPDAFCLNGKILNGLLASSTNENIEFAKADGAVTIKTGRSTFKLPFDDFADYPFREPKFEGSTFAVQEAVLGGIKACLLTSSRDQAQPALMGVCVAANGKELTLYSTDGDAVSKYITGLKTNSTFTRIVPNSFFETLVLIYEDTDAESALLIIGEEWASAHIGSFIVYGRLIEADNPVDHEDLIKKTLKAKALVPIPPGLTMALSRARVVSDIETVPTVLRVEGKTLRLTTENRMGTIKDIVTFEGHPSVEANVSAELVQRCLTMTSQMAIQDNCCVFKDGNLLILVSNMD